LKVLIQRAGRVFSREQLMDLAWEEPDISFDRSVVTHIKTIRAKLKAINPDVDPINTHRGLGFVHPIISSPLLVWFKVVLFIFL